MTAVLIVVGVILLGVLALLVTRRRAAEGRFVQIRERELEGHRAEAGAHEQRAREQVSAATKRRQEADRLEQEAEQLQAAAAGRRSSAQDLDQRGDRSLRFARHHEEAAEETREDLDKAGKRFRLRAKS